MKARQRTGRLWSVWILNTARPGVPHWEPYGEAFDTLRGVKGDLAREQKSYPGERFAIVEETYRRLVTPRDPKGSR